MDFWKKKNTKKISLAEVKFQKDPKNPQVKEIFQTFRAS
jgi:hypothetical protein